MVYILEEFEGLTLAHATSGRRTALRKYSEREVRVLHQNSGCYHKALRKCFGPNELQIALVTEDLPTQEAADW